MNELYHYGTKGMKWGVRRYQNQDGSLTSAGKNRNKVGFFIPSPTVINAAGHAVHKIKEAIKLHKANEAIKDSTVETASKPDNNESQSGSIMASYVHDIVNRPLQDVYAAGSSAGYQAIVDSMATDVKLNDALSNFSDPLTIGGGNSDLYDEASSIVNWAKTHGMSVEEAMAELGYSKEEASAYGSSVSDIGEARIDAAEDLNSLIKKKKTKTTAKKTTVGKKKTTSAKPLNKGSYYHVEIAREGIDT